jgi:hypothetical protein
MPVLEECSHASYVSTLLCPDTKQGNNTTTSTLVEDIVLQQLYTNVMSCLTNDHDQDEPAVLTPQKMALKFKM